MKRHTPREGKPDSADEAEFSFKLPKTRVPEPIMHGVRGWRTSEDYLVIRCHYSCDPDRADKEWIKETLKGYRGGQDGPDWQREMEIDFGSYAGRPVYPQFNKVGSVTPVKYNPTLPLWRGWDFGYRNPAVVFLQLWPDDTLVFLHEIFPTQDKQKLPGISTPDLARMVLSETERLFPGASDMELGAGVYDFCDPAGVQTKETSDFSSVEHLQQMGIYPDYSVVGRKIRIDYARVYIEGKHDTGKPKFLINPHCTLGIEALSAAYRYPEDNAGGADREMPDTKSKRIQSEPFIHIIDAFEYVVACNLEITFQTKTGWGTVAEENKVADLASIYLGATEANDRRDLVDKTDSLHTDSLEEEFADIVGREDLLNAFIDY
jgi:hypothetical protein